MMKLNGHNYSFEEIKAALISRGYTIVPFSYTYSYQWGNHDGYADDVEINSFCAVTGDEKPSKNNLYTTVAQRIWNKPKFKPKLT